MLRKLLAFAGIITVTTFSVSPAHADHLNATLNVDPDASVTTDRLVVFVTGTYTCGPLDITPNPQGDFTAISVVVRQASGRDVNQGFGFAPVTCDDTLRTFQAPATDQILVPWHGGQARVNATLSMQDCDEFFIDCHLLNISEERQIKIKGGAK